ncbi:2100_t:CDS:1, partial [Scutellospora calospora]
NNNKENSDMTVNTTEKNLNNNILKQKEPLKSLSTWDEKETQDFEREKTNLLQEMKENRDNKNKTTEKKYVILCIII